FFANNTNWQTLSQSFTATQNGTPLQIEGLQPGVLLDSFTLADTTPLGLYYLPEESLKALAGENAYGEWQLEIWDSRAGATNLVSLFSWQLSFVFENTTPIPRVVTPGVPQTNTVPGGATAWYLVNTPTNADWATNSLIFATLPLNLWWSTNEPPTTTNATDVLLLANSTGGSAVIGTNPPPAFFVPGKTYYLGVQNPNTNAATYAIEVTFRLLSTAPFVITQPATNLAPWSATLNASVNPNGSPATVYFEYGLTTNYGFFSPSIDLTNNLNLTQWVGIAVTNLAPATVYHFHAIATNSFGTNYGGDLTFTTPYATPPPFAATLPATLITGAGAQLNGMATPNGEPATAWFEWGTSTGYGSTTPPVSVGSNFNVVFVNPNITGLMTNVAFHYRLVVSNIVGVTYGFDQVFAQGSVVAWGAQFAGQTTPIPSGLTNLVAGVGAGYDFSLALNYDGTVVAWGGNSVGQTNVPTGLNNAVSVAGGYSHSLALRSARTVTVWGSNSAGQTNVPPDLTNAVAAASGGYHCLALRDDGNPVAWGLDTSGQTNIPAGLSNVVAVAAGYSHCLAVINNGTVVAWGNNAFGQTNVPAGLTNVVAIAAGRNDSLALKNNGTVVAWGSNANGQTNVPASLTNVTAIAAGDYHCLALKGDGSVWFWGDSSSGQLNFYPTNLTNVFAIAGGGFHTVSAVAPYGLNVTNTPPYWTNGLDGTTIAMDELTTLSVNNAALDSNSPPQLVFYSFVNNPPAWTSLDAFSGTITLKPQEVDGPTNVVITTVATDNGYPPLSATNSFTLIVNEVNVAPFWPTNVPGRTNYVVNALTTLIVTNTASDADIPTNTLSYTISVSPTANAPAISTNGIITWQPLTSGVFTLTTIVTDFNAYALTNQSLTATNFITVTVTNGSPPPIPVSITSIIYTNGGFLLTWFAPSNDLFQVQWTASLAPANWNTFTNPPVVSYNTNAFTSPTNTQFNFFDDGLQTGGFDPMRFYRVILLSSPVPPGIITLTNGIPYFNTNTPAVTNQDYYRYVVTTNAARAQFEINGASADFSLVARRGTVPPLPSLTVYDYLSANAGTNDELIVVLTNSTPVALTPGDWFLTAVNLSGASATYAIKATEWPETGRPLVVTGTQVTATNFCITWSSLPGVHYYVEGLTNLSSTNWVIASPTITAVTTSTTWCASLPSAFQFFRVREGLVLSPGSFVAAPPTNTSVTAGTNGLTITWTGGLGARYQVQWTPALLPPTWTSFTNVIASATTQFSFLDDGTQAGGLGVMRFYRVQQVP
ncbi:MAG: hypothetical protein MUF81_03700, partial [Verrucomicrobia bacterium]|nr:hypothetical protein [Verrucomicrobiota bacterium]